MKFVFLKHIPTLFIHILYLKVNFYYSIYRGMCLGQEGVKLFPWTLMLYGNIYAKTFVESKELHLLTMRLSV